MKTPQAVARDIERRLASSWHLEAAGLKPSFPHDFPLGRTAAGDLRTDYAAIHDLTVTWQGWAKAHGVELAYVTRMAKGGTRQAVPTHARVHSSDHAATIVGNGWPERLARGRARFTVLLHHYDHLDTEAVGRVLRIVDSYAPLDFSLLLAVANWYRADPALGQGVTPRQVPIPGVHAKWLQSHRAAVLALSGLEDLGLLAPHPARIHFTYLDPAHRAAGFRVHDSATVGDSLAPAYDPTVVLISENKDTAIHFPPLPGAISVEGVGRGGKTIAAFPWIRQSPTVVYWGDMDRDGYEILDGYREDFDRDLDSILMDMRAYEEFEPFGTDTDQNGRELVAGPARAVERLRLPERAVYELLVAAGHTRHRRVEQERIPLSRAMSEVEELLRRRH